jgi:hypothetical protein
MIATPWIDCVIFMLLCAFALIGVMVVCKWVWRIFHRYPQVTAGRYLKRTAINQKEVTELERMYQLR